MKVAFFIFLVLLTLCGTNNCENAGNLKSLSIAIKNITRTLFESCGEVLITRFKDDEKTIESLILKSARDENIPFKVKNIDAERVNSSNAIVTLSHFKKLNTYLDIKPRSIKVLLVDQKSFLVYVHAFDSDIDPMVQVANKYSSQLRDFYFIIEDDHFIKLKTLVWFLPGQCGVTTLVEVNSFSKKDNVWLKSSYTIKKFRDFHGCRISIRGSQNDVFVTIANHQLSVFSKKVKKKRSNPIDNILNSLMMSHLNFTIARPAEELYKFQFDIYLPLVDRIENNTVNLNIYKLFYTKPLIYRNFYLGIPVGVPYDAYEKLILPFDDDVWALILVTFFVTFVTIFILRVIQGSIRNFVVGENVSNPAFNVVLIIFGLSQDPLPRRSSARFLMMIFVLYCLIMRTAWQGMMFEFMQKDMRRPEMKSISEMVQQNFTLYMDRDDITNLGKSDFFKK